MLELHDGNQVILTDGQLKKLIITIIIYMTKKRETNCVYVW